MVECMVEEEEWEVGCLVVEWAAECLVVEKWEADPAVECPEPEEIPKNALKCKHKEWVIWLLLKGNRLA